MGLLGGLTPGATYAVCVWVDLVTNVPAGSVGIGGSLGSSVFVKAGASTIEPDTFEDSNGYLRMTIDKGNPSRGGESMAVLGSVAHPQVEDREYRIKTLDSLGLALRVDADDEGRVWLVVGTDSGFEGLTRLYYTRISYTLAIGTPSTLLSGPEFPELVEGLSKDCRRAKDQDWPFVCIAVLSAATLPRAMWCPHS